MISYKCESLRDRSSILMDLVEKGYVIHSTLIEEIFDRESFYSYPAIFFDKEDSTISMCHGNDDDYKYVSKEKFFESLICILPLNDDYTAYIQDDYVEVGCQEISFEIIDELHKRLVVLKKIK